MITFRLKYSGGDLQQLTTRREDAGKYVGNLTIG